MLDYLVQLYADVVVDLHTNFLFSTSRLSIHHIDYYPGVL